MKYITGKVRWGIIGAGNVCEKKSGPAFNKVPDSELYAVMRRNIEKARDYARRHNVEHFTSDAGELLNDPRINAIYIATPPAYHEEYTLKALQAGKAVYIEKPVTLNAASCERMIHASEKFKLPVSVAHYRRGLDLFRKVNEILAESVIGKVLFVTINTFQSTANDLVADPDLNWRVDPKISGGGIFHDLAPHQLDLMFWYFGKPVKLSGYSTNQGHNYEASDYTRLDVLFEQNIFLNGQWSFAVHESADKENCEIIGTRGKISFSFFRSPVLEIYTGNGCLKMEFPFPENIQHPMIEKVVGFFRGKNENPCSLREALESIQMLDATVASF